MQEFIVIFVTVGSSAEGERLAFSLVEERLAACVNRIRGIQSVYRWEGKVQDENEVLVLLKTQGRQYESLKARILALHPYEVPEVIAIPVERGHQAYLDWILRETT